MILSPIEGGRLVAAGQRCKDNYEPVVHCGEAELQQSQMGRGRGVGERMPTYLRFLGRSKGLQEAPSSIFVARCFSTRISCDAIRGGVWLLGSSRDDRNRANLQCARSSKTHWKDRKQAKEDTMGGVWGVVIRWKGLRVQVFPI